MPVGPTIIVHGGAGEIPPDRLSATMRGMKTAAAEGYAMMLKGGTAVDAVEQAIRCLEDNEYFNAGYGGALNSDYEVELDASIMDGSSMAAGAAAIVKDIRYPISLARKIMENCPHVLLAGLAASEFAMNNGVAMVNPDELISDFARGCVERSIKESASKSPYGDSGDKNGTVGVVAYDNKGHVAAGTSTGGAVGHLPGRVGDSALIGLGTYADGKIGAVSCTGHGESVMKAALAHSVIKTMEKGAHPNNACRINVDKLTQRFNTEAGAIAVSKSGEVGFFTTSPHMPLAYITNDILHSGHRINRIEVENEYKIYLKRKMNCCCTTYKCIDRPTSNNNFPEKNTSKIQQQQPNKY